MNATEILQQQTTKTAKIQMLLALGLSRKEVASLMGVGYGFVQNIYAKAYPERIRSRVVREVIAEFNFQFTRTFGIEIEMFNVERDRLVAALREAGIEAASEYYNHSTRPYWKIVSDSSVQGTEALELVSPILRGEEGLSELRKVCGILKRLNAKINKSCGMHVHLGMNDIGEDIRVWRNLFHNYATLEPLIDGFMPASCRANQNTYCKSMRVGDFARKIEQSRTLRGLEAAITFSSRYFKLNAQAYWRHQTIEFRQHSGTIEFEKIANWVLFAARLVEFSKTQRVTGGTFEDAARFSTPSIISFFRSRSQQLAVAA